MLPSCYILKCTVVVACQPLHLFCLLPCVALLCEAGRTSRLRSSSVTASEREKSFPCLVVSWPKELARSPLVASMVCWKRSVSENGSEDAMCLVFNCAGLPQQALLQGYRVIEVRLGCKTWKCVAGHLTCCVREEMAS